MKDDHVKDDHHHHGQFQNITGRDIICLENDLSKQVEAIFLITNM